MTSADKIRFLTAGLDPASADGLEIGPRDAPLITKAMGRISYADYAETVVIKANLAGTEIDPATVVDVDIVTGGGKLSAATQQRFDYILASHVAEHVPDLIGWLQDLHCTLRPGGLLGLAIPDRRFTFDLLRTDSTIAEALEAWLLGYDRPSLRQVIDSAWQAVEITPAQAWCHEGPATDILRQRHHRLPKLLAWATQLHASQAYADAHCWVFTPASFLILLEQLAHLGLFEFQLDGFHPTQPGGYEFLVRLRRADAANGNILPPIAQALAAQAARAGEPARELAAARQEIAALRDQVSAIRASTSWRITAPLRRLGAGWVR